MHIIKKDTAPRRANNKTSRRMQTTVLTGEMTDKGAICDLVRFLGCAKKT